jgi:hypothetical protein
MLRVSKGINASPGLLYLLDRVPWFQHMNTKNRETAAKKRKKDSTPSQVPSVNATVPSAYPVKVLVNKVSRLSQSFRILQ